MVTQTVDEILHKPVMMEDALGLLNLKPGQVIVDATAGTGGHSQAILQRISPGGRLIAIDRDEESLNVCRRRLSEFGDAVSFMHANFVDLDSALDGLNIQKINGILFDLGISSFQLDDPQRGFSFQREGPLDMRMDRSSYISAHDLINNLNEDELSDMLWTFGQERWHNRIAHLIVEERQKQPISTTQELVSIVERSIPQRYRHKYYRIHPATRTFQAVRIVVNRELEILDAAISKAIQLLDKHGRICVISFHSLEDRAIKHGFRRAASEGLIEIITPKPLVPGQEETAINPSSRSSKLRAAERLLT